MKISKSVEDYLDKHWLAKESIKKGLVNFSELARTIASELGLDPEKNFHAILIACRRYCIKLKHPEQEQKILDLLKKSKLHIKTKIARIVLDKNTKPSALHFIRGEHTNVAIIEEDELEKIRQTYKHNIIAIRKNLAEVLLVSQKQVEETIGVSAYLTSLFADAGINVYTVIGSYNEDIFIIEQKDVSAVLEFLDKIIH